MIRLFAFALTGLVVLVSLVSSVTSAQRNRGGAPARGPGWLPRKSELLATEFKVTAAELTTVINRLTEIERIFAQVEETSILGSSTCTSASSAAAAGPPSIRCTRNSTGPRWRGSLTELGLRHLEPRFLAC